ncbi:MAG: hypothetical protein ACRCYY_09395 [Trueperaceae bacterium]
MKDLILTRTPLEITDEKRVAFLCNGEKMQYLDPFLKAECSLREAAQEVGVKLNVMSYWVKVLLELGFIQETRSEARQGRPIKYYQTVSDIFIVPLAAISHDQYIKLLSGLFQVDWQLFLASMAQQLLKNAEHLQLRYFHIPPRGRRVSIEERQLERHTNDYSYNDYSYKDLDDGLNNWGTFHLEPEAFRRYTKVMLELQLSIIEESKKLSQEEHQKRGHKKYLFHFGFVERL